MAARLKRVPNWAAFLLGALAAFAVMIASLVLAGSWRAPTPRLFALDLRLPSAPPIPDTPSLPPPPIPIPK
jgi:hypothetical protein